MMVSFRAMVVLIFVTLLPSETVIASSLDSNLTAQARTLEQQMIERGEEVEHRSLGETAMTLSFIHDGKIWRNTYRYEERDECFRVHQQTLVLQDETFEPLGSGQTSTEIICDETETDDMPFPWMDVSDPSE